MTAEGGGGAGFEEWDADFLNQLIHVEEHALSSSSSFPPAFPQPPSYLPSLPSYLLPLPQPLPPRNHPKNLPHACPLSYSPPRELSQRPPPDSVASRELGFPLPPQPSSAPPPPQHLPKNLPPPCPLRYSPPRELSQRPPPDTGAICELGLPLPPLHTPTKAPRILQTDRGEIRNKRGRKREPLHQLPDKSICPPYPDRGKVTLWDQNVRERDVEVPSSVSLGVASAEATDDHIRFQADMEATFRAVGVQADAAPESTGSPSVNEFSAHQKLSNNLRSIWCCPKPQQLPSTLLSKLFAACHSLFCAMNADRSFKPGTDCLSDKSSANASEVAMVSTFYSSFIEVSNGMSRLENLFQPIFDLCSVDNVAILSRSLNIMYLILDHILTTERVFGERNNVVWKGLPSTNNFGADQSGNKECGFHPSVSCSEGAPTVFASEDLMLTNVKSQLGMGDFKCGPSLYSSNLISIFGLMHELVKRNTEECIRLGAVSIMKAILLKGSAYEDRATFPLPQAFGSVLILLKRGSGKKLQEHALHLLFLLLNCPKIFEAFVVSCEDTNNVSIECQDSNGIFPGIYDILESLADCVSDGGSTVQDLIHRRKAVVLVAFIASSGLKGFEIVISSTLSNEKNILMVMLQALVSDLDIEGGSSTESPEILRERNLLMREALILLNRLISSQSSSAGCLRLLTSTRDAASLTTDFASRMCKRQPRCIQPDGNRLRDLDNLARTFKRRVFSYLGDQIT